MNFFFSIRTVGCGSRLVSQRISAAVLCEQSTEQRRGMNATFRFISVWEIGLLFSKIRIQLRVSPIEWVHDALTSPGITLLTLSYEAALEASDLPGEFHGDPADRLLVATARHLRATMVTADERILEYGRGKHLNILPA